MKISNYAKNYLEETARIAKKIDIKEVQKVLGILSEIKNINGRIFFLGVGGGAGTGSHASNDFNKIAGISTICLSDNPSLLTALANDEGWPSIFKRQLEMHRLSSSDCLFVYSVGGGTETVSKNITVAIQYAKKIGAKIVGVVGKNTGTTAKEANACIIVPCIAEERRTAHTEDFQLIIDHLLVNFFNQSEKDEK